MAAPQTEATQQHPLNFSKMAGGGNDFVIIDNRAGRVGDAVDLTRRICTAHLSVGGDGLILVEPSTAADFRMRYYNNDGSPGEFCANGTRCAARFAVVNGIAPQKMTIETDAGIVGADVSDNRSVTLTLPSPRAFRAERPLRVDDRTIRGSSILVGVPHYVLFPQDPGAARASAGFRSVVIPAELGAPFWSLDIVPPGRSIRFHPDLKPDGGANVNFVNVRDEHSIEVRTYERGVEAETLSCGSGVVASVATCALFGKVSSPVSVLTRSGITLRVAFTREANEIRDLRLTGDARLIYTAALTAETIEGFDPDWVRDPQSTECRVPSAE